MADKPVGKEKKLVVLLNARTPYWVHTYQRLAEHISIPLQVIFLYEGKDNPWKVPLPDCIHGMTIPPDRDRKHGGFQTMMADYGHAKKLSSHIINNGFTDVILHGYHKPLAVFLAFMLRSKVDSINIRADSNIRSQKRNSILKHALKKLYLRMMALLVDRFLPFGRLGKEYFVSHGITDDKIKIAPVEPNYSVFSEHNPAIEEELKQELSLREDRKRIIFVGRLVPEKGPELLLNAFLQLASARNEWDLVYVGDGPMKQQLSESVPDQYRDRVIWAGFHPVDRVRSLMHLSDIFVLPSRYEPWALVVNEALAAGLCCMVSQVVAAGVEVLEENDTTIGPLVFKHNDEAALLEALVKVTDLRHIDQYKEYCQKQYGKYRITMDSAEMTKKALNL